mgnify:CR=1 FL=1
MLLYLLLKFAKVHLPERRRNHLDVTTNEDEFDRELFEPTNDGWDGDEDAMGGDHGLHDKNLNDDRVNQEPAQGNMMRFIYHVTNPA